MKVKNKKTYLLIGLAVVVALMVFSVATLFNRDEKTEEIKPAKPQEISKEEEPTTEVQIKDGISYVRDILIVNKKHSLPQDYNPGENELAGQEIRRLIVDGKTNGLELSESYSGFRSYDVQTNIYNGYVSQDGQENADTYSARPGYSEHQTGLAFDLLNFDGDLIKPDRNSREVQWVKEHAHEYGFIVRYQEGKEDITGYMAESWHLRYVGAEATAIKESGLTLEEYLGVTGGGY